MENIKNTITIELTVEQLVFLRDLTQDTAYELRNVSSIKVGDKKLAHTARLAQEVDQSINRANIQPTVVI